MVRPKKQRIIEAKPLSAFFAPLDVPAETLEEVFIGIDEIEALRLTNLESMSQEETAEKMGISRQLVGLILSNARKKITEALLHAKAIRIVTESENE